MHKQTSISARITAGLTLAATLAASTGTLPSMAATLAAAPGSVRPTAATLQSAAGIIFTATIPTLQKPLPLFRLARTAAPASFVKQVIGAAQPMSMEGTRIVARDSRGTMHAYADAATGEAQIFPDFASTGAAAQPATLENAASAVFSRGDVIPKDATTARITDVIPVMSAQASHGSDGSSQALSAPQRLFTYYTVTRYAAGLPVFGDSSQATVGVGNNGSIRAFVRRWQAASPAGEVAPATTPAQLVASIDAQLKNYVERDVTITVDSIKPAYYDGNAKYLQPVYEFEATMHPSSKITSNEHVRGFVPVGKLVEPIRVLGVKNGAGPSSPHPAGSGGPMVSQIMLGQYANDDGSMQDMANAYYNGFDSVSPGVYGPPINRIQWYWAETWQVLSDANSYLNAMNVAYTMPHGNWWVNTTNGTGGSPWYVDQIGVGGNPGYGSASGGHLAAWIIDSCEVIPSYYDLQYTTGNGNSAFTYWWPVFQGLHRALGFRTEMLLGEDTMNYDIAQSMAEGAGADNAFYNGVAAVSFGTYTDGHLGLTVHYDRVSIMHDPRNYNETIYAIQGQSASGTLNNVWMSN